LSTKNTKEDAPLKSVLSVLGTDMFLFPFTIVIGALVTRYLGPANKGIYSFIILIYGIFPSIIMLGNTGSVRYYLSKKNYEVKEVFGSVLLMIFYFSIVMSTRIFLQYFAAVGMPLKNALIQGMGFLAGIPLYIILIHQIGVIGAAIASSVAYLTTNIVAIYLYNKHGHPVSLNMYIMNKDDWQWINNKYQEVFLKLKAKIGR